MGQSILFHFRFGKRQVILSSTPPVYEFLPVKTGCDKLESRVGMCPKCVFFTNWLPDISCGRMAQWSINFIVSIFAFEHCLNSVSISHGLNYESTVIVRRFIASFSRFLLNVLMAFYLLTDVWSASKKILFCGPQLGHSAANFNYVAW